MRPFITPHRWRDVLHVAGPDQQALSVLVIVDRVRHCVRDLRDRAVLWNTRPPLRCQARRLRWPSLFRIGHTLPEGMQPDDRAPERGGFEKHVSFCGDREAQAGCREVIVKTRCEGRVSRHGRHVGDDILGAHGFVEALREEGQQLRRKIRPACVGIAPEREDTATASVVVVKVGNHRRHRQSGTVCRRVVAGGGDEDLMIRADSPQFGIRLIHHAVVWDDPLPVERAEAVEDWRCALAMLIGDWCGSDLIAGKAIVHNALAVPVSGSLPA